MKQYIAIAGNIGAGKSTLTRLLSERLGCEPFYEAVAENPYLADFYQNMRQWSFHSQVFFLSRRLRQHRQLLDRAGSVVQDRSVYEDAEIFARNLYLQGSMDERDYGAYRELYETLTMFLPPPDLVIYLRAQVPTLMQRIALRGRDYERSISVEYVARLNELYEEWIGRFTLCRLLVLPTDDLNFIEHHEHLDLIAERVQDELSNHGALI
jgi:deoxyadenosine/deoxycytidine kinase